MRRRQRGRQRHDNDVDYTGDDVNLGGDNIAYTGNYVDHDLVDHNYQYGPRGNSDG
jgi:hypothetical protein